MKTFFKKQSTLICCFLLSFFGHYANAQGISENFFAKAHSISRDSILTDLKMADFNNDGKMDLLALSSDSANHETILLMLGEDSLKWGLPAVLYQDAIGIIDWLITDLDNNNRMDLVISTHTALASENRLKVVYNLSDGSHSSAIQIANINGAGSIFSADFDQNGWRDLAVSSASLDIFFQNHGQFIHYQLDSLEENPSRVFVADYNNDTHKDLLISWQSDQDFYSEWWTNSGQGTFSKNPKLPWPSISLMDEMDVNNDGFPDYAMYNDSGHVQLYIQLDDSLQLFNAWPVDSVQNLFLADFNADGLTDLLVGAAVSRILFQNSDTTFTEQILDLPKHVAMAMAHLDADGNLDLVLAHSDTLGKHVSIYQNTSPTVNEGPSSSFLSAGIYMDGDLRIFWEDASDDFTHTISNTYDVHVHGKVQSDFNWVNYQRLLLNKGNAGYAQEYIIKDVGPGQVEYSIQSIDNAYKTSNQVCSGSAPICDITEYTFEQLCGPLDFTPSFEEPRAWYSAKRGFMGFHASINEHFSESDTLYSVLPFTLSCHDQKAWIINISPELELSSTGDTTICTGAYYEYQLDESIWAEATWHTSLNGQISDSTYVDIKLMQNDTLFVEAITHLGCSVYDTIILNIVPLKINLFNDTTVCLSSSLFLELPQEEWESVVWMAENLDTLSTANPFQMAVDEAMQIMLHVVSVQGCIAFDTIQVGIENIVATTDSENLTIFKGQTAQLHASGGQNYHWSPAISLDDPFSPSPQAGPLESTVYEVYVSGEWGCVDTAQVSVTVLNQAFASNLFSPNSDGQNDNWRIIELEGVATFKLVIVDREGQIMYETDQEYEAANIGWDGTKNGNPQPAGIYFWKVSGQYQEGNEITLNGKRDGQIMLMR